MTTRNVLTVSSIIAFIFGIAFVLAAKPLTALYNITLDDSGAFLGQLFGAALIGFGVLNWFARNSKDSQAMRAVVWANLVADVIGFVIALIGQIQGIGGVNALGWSTVVIYLLLALAFLYLSRSTASSG
jgi:hypothetical protein